MRKMFLWKQIARLLVITNIVAMCSIYDPINNNTVLAADDYSQIESFEAASIPSSWATESGGSIALSSRHYKHGQKSLAWTWNNNSKLRDVKPINLAESNIKNGGMKIWIYNETPINDQVTFNFGTISEINSGVYHHTFKANLNFKGWRALWIKFREEGKNPAYTKSLSNVLEVMQIVPPSSTPSGTLYFDNIEFSPQLIKARTADYQMPKPGIDVGVSTWDNLYYYSLQQPTIPLEPTITQTQIDSFNTIADKYNKWVFGDALNYAGLTAGPLKTRYDAVQTFISEGLEAYNNLNITRHFDGTITGSALYASRDPHLLKFGEDVSKTVLLSLVFDYKINGNIASKQKVIDVLDYMNDQGWAFGSALGTQDHETNKNNGYFHTIFLMRDELKAAGIFDREMRTCFWYDNFGKTFDNSTYVETTADEYRTLFMYNLLYVLGMDNTPTKVQYMKGLLGMYEQALGTIAPGYADVIKPDGTLFHHRAAYMNAYGPDAIHFASLVAYLLGGTSFSLSDASYNNIKKALLTEEIISNKYDMAIGATGRIPDKSNGIVSILPAYAYLALANNPVDSELAATFMRLWDSQSSLLNTQLFSFADSYGVAYKDTMGGLQLAVNFANMGYSPKANPQGFWVKPYAALAVNRINDIMIGIKGWSRYSWDYEASKKFNPESTETLSENVYGRYQSYGNMQIITSNGILESGINTGAGWDWSRWPGTTVKHLTLDELQFTETSQHRSFNDSTFVGGASLQNKHGVFAMDLHDTVFDTSFRAKKSVFFFGDKIISLGSDIVNTDTGHQTETVLFQTYMPTSTMPLYLNSTNAITSASYNNVLNGTTPAWIVDPYGNGYVLPNPSGTVISRGVQISKNSGGSEDTSGSYSTAYINHGSAPSSVGYEYAIKAGAGAQGTADFAAHPRYTVLQKNSNAHIVQNTVPGQNITGYAIFNSNVPITQGILQNSTAPAMVMIQDVSSSELALSMSDPDLRLPQYTDSSKINADDIITPSVMNKVTLKLQGAWELKKPSTEARVKSVTSTTTTIEFDCVDGKTIDIGLVQSTTQSVTIAVTFESQGGSGIAPFQANAGVLITAPTAPTKAGYSFAGWYKEESLTNAWKFDMDRVPSTGVTLYAKWLSNNVLLSSLTVDQGMLSPTFTSSNMIYTVDVANAVSSINLSLIKNDPKATLTVTGAVYSSVTNNVYTYSAANLIVGTNPIQIMVTAEDGTINLYDLTVNRAAEASGNADLSGLTLSSGTLSPAFASGTTTYTSSVASGVSSLAIMASVYDSHATMTVNGISTASGQASGAISLNVGSNPITIVVTAQNGTTKVYAVNVNRAAEASGNADLSGLTLSSGTLSPAFASGITAYSSSVASGVSSLVVTASMYDSHATMTVNGISTASGQASGAISLNIGSNPITIVVTAQNGTTKTYVITVNRVGSSTRGSTPLSDNTVTTGDGKLTLPSGKTGNVSLGDAVVVVIPADATDKELKITIDKVLETQNLLTNTDVLASQVYEILKNFPENFSKPVTLTLAFDPASLKSNQMVAVFYYDEVKKAWVEVRGGKVNGSTITVEVDHFTKFAVFVVSEASSIGTQATISFTDIAGHWAETNIKQAASGGIVSGYTDGSFKPNHTVTRAEFAVMLMNTLKPQGEGKTLTFTDTAKIGAWAQKAVAQAVQAGIIQGYEDNAFRPDAEVTRAEMAVMIAKALNLKAESITEGGFADEKDIPMWARGAVAAIKKPSIIEGKDSNRFDPNGKTLRAEAATVLLKMRVQKSN
ncbi:hypothetical protein GC093_11095 [Paenibacillus sp. LMG 31456]|uniref:SLH domain-containing protein n=1 Tax=Paenibacillus foliorum TaxID=2654974 RepID=A0A972GSQ8_9BACL|nr:chondroitinase family polysaccharide lyase [Paenibacillus foliorum]NOU93764.1 hypothetical protein [Paenibacillus foliorum]